jgi:uncharacterized RDD family membrane protein YckC
MKSDSLFELQRLGAFLVDMLILLLIAFLFFPLSSWTNTHWQLSIAGLGMIQAIYFILFLGPLSTAGQTPGQRIFNQKLISIFGNDLKWKQVIPRGLMMFAILIFELPIYSLIFDHVLLRILFEIFAALLFFNIFWVILDPYKRTLMDIFTNTLVSRADHERPKLSEGKLPKVNIKGGLLGVLILMYGLFLRSSYVASSQTVYFFRPPTEFTDIEDLRTQGIINRNQQELNQKDSSDKKSTLYVCGFRFLGLLPVKLTALFPIESSGIKK